VKHLVHPALGSFCSACLAQLPVFVTAMWASRRMAAAPWPGFSEGGALWFPDLTLPAVDLSTQMVQVLPRQQDARRLGFRSRRIHSQWLSGRLLPKLAGRPCCGDLISQTSTATPRSWSTDSIVAHIVVLLMPARMHAGTGATGQRRHRAASGCRRRDVRKCWLRLQHRGHRRQAAGWGVINPKTLFLTARVRHARVTTALRVHCHAAVG